MKKQVMLPLGTLFLLMLLDGQISTLLMNILSLGATSRLLLLALVFMSHQKADVRNVLIFACIGFLYDVYYLNLIGIATTLLPVFASVLGPIRKNLRFNLLNFLLLSLIVIFFYELLSYFLAIFIGIGNLDFEKFVVKMLAPTLIWNLLQSLVLYPLLLTILKRTRHRIVTLA